MKFEDENNSVAKELSQIRLQLVKITTMLSGILAAVIALSGVALMPLLDRQTTSPLAAHLPEFVMGFYVLAILGAGIAGLTAAVINRKTALAQNEERMTALLLEVESAATATSKERG